MMLSCRCWGRVFVFGTTLCLSIWIHVGAAQEKSVRPGINDPFKDPDVQKFREVFEFESREIFAQRKDLVAACQLKPGMVIADVGAGTGLFTLLFAREVGPTGKVYAVEIAQKFLDHIQKLAKDQKLTNVHGILGSHTSTELPPDSVDVVFICDTYHHFEFPFRIMQSIHRALKSGGQVFVIDFHRIPGKSREWVLNHVRAGQDVVTREITSCGFKLVEDLPLLKENYAMRFVKVEAAPDNKP